jgi:rRNA maturation protein Nop10
MTPLRFDPRYTLRPCADGYELAISPPAVFSTADAAAAWIERREAERGRVEAEPAQMELWERAA